MRTVQINCSHLQIWPIDLDKTLIKWKGQIFVWDAYQKWCLFPQLPTAASCKKDSFDGHPKQIFGLSYFVRALVFQLDLTFLSNFKVQNQVEDNSFSENLRLPHFLVKFFFWCSHVWGFEKYGRLFTTHHFTNSNCNQFYE